VILRTSDNKENANQTKFYANYDQQMLQYNSLCGIPMLSGSSKGQVLGMRYAIELQLSEDNMGCSYKAEDAADNTNVLIRALPTFISSDPKQIKFLKNHTEKLVSLSHPNICRLKRFEINGRVKYFVYEYVDGLRLDKMLVCDRLIKLEKVLSIFSHIAAGLDHAHSKGFIHGDINPENIIVVGNKGCKITDFMLSRLIKDAIDTTTGVDTEWSNRFNAPEQFNGGQVNKYSDIYSLAACIYELLSTDQTYWRGWMDYHRLKEEPESLVQLSDKQNEILRKSLSRNPQDRHSSAIQLLTELRDSVGRIVVKKVAIEQEKGFYKDSLTNIKQKTQEQNQNTEYEATIKNLISDVEQLKAKITEQEVKLVAALTEVDKKITVLVQDRENTLNLYTKTEKAFEVIQKSVQQQEQKYASQLCQAEERIKTEILAKSQVEKQLAAYEETIKQLQEKTPKQEDKFVAALNEAEKTLKLELSGAEERIKVETKARVQTEQKRAAYEKTIKKLEAEIAEHKDKQAITEDTIKQLKEKIINQGAEYEAALSEAEGKFKVLILEEKKALQQRRRNEEALKEAKAEARQQQQEFVEQLDKAQWKIRALSTALSQADKKIEVLTTGTEKQKSWT
jgi:serine/threonine protein kinase